MRKNLEENKGRVLARLLAEDLRNIKVTGAGATVTITEGGGRRDITNVGGDGDAD